MSKQSEKEINDFVEVCSKGFSCAKNEINSKTDEQLIEIKAELKGKLIHYDKWNGTLMPFIGLAVAVVAIVVTFLDTDICETRIVITVLLIVGFVTICLHSWNQDKKSKAITTLSYIEDIKRDNNTNYLLQQELESYEQVCKRQKEECKKIRNMWIERQKYAQRQIELFDRKDSL